MTKIEQDTASEFIQAALTEFPSCMPKGSMTRAATAIGTEYTRAADVAAKTDEWDYVIVLENWLSDNKVLDMFT